MFKTARFKVHNPSRHKSVILWYAMTHYHQALKQVLEEALALPDLPKLIGELDNKGRYRPNKFRLSRQLYQIAPKGWELAPLRDYLVGDASAMIMSHLSKSYKGENESNPPTLGSLEPLTVEEFESAYRELTALDAQPAIKPQHRKKIAQAQDLGQTRVARRLSKIYANWGDSRTAGQILRKLEGALPRPIEFTRNEFKRGCLLAFRDGRYYLLVRLFAEGHRYCDKTVLKDGFTNCKTKEALGGKKYPGLILPLELGREFHEREYLTHGQIQSAKLVVKRHPGGAADASTSALAPGSAIPFNAAEYEFFIHAAFEFQPEPVETKTFLGIDRGAVKLGAGTLIGLDGKRIEAGLDLDGAAFSAEMRKHQDHIGGLQQKGIQRSRRFSLRGKRADIVLGEYANRIVSLALEHRAQIVIEAIRGVTMGRFLKQSQFARLKQMLTYKAARLGLPAPIEVPAAFTSQTCSECGHKDAASRPKKDKGGKAVRDLFLCVQCGYRANADANASEIIALRGLHQNANGGKFKKYDLFQRWLKETLSAGTAAAPQGEGRQ